MKKLLTSAAVCGLVFAAAPAHADVDLELGGYFKGYGAYVDQDENAGNNHAIDFIRNTEIHFTGETTLDNGLIVGAHLETAADAADAFAVDESYLYFAGSWGRVNAGAEDGAGYLLQVAAPSADSNIDGIRQFVNPVNYAVLGGAGLGGAQAIGAANGLAGQNQGGLDYDMDISGKSDKLTYLSPVLNGFQLGASYAPDSDAATENGVGTDDTASDETYEAAVRYEGQFNNVGVTAGAGFAHTEDGSGAAGSDDRQAWNVGLDLDFGPFGLGAIYREDDGGNNTNDEETFVVGVDYTTGPFKLGASYYDQENSYTTTTDTQRYSGGVTYTYGPGMTFRGSIGYVEHELQGASDVDATYVTLGTQVNF